LAQETVPHLLTKRRQDLVAVRTQTINRLHRLLLDLVPGGARRNLTAKRAAALLDQVAPTGAPAVTRWQLAGELVADVRQLEQRITAVEARIRPRSPGPGPAVCRCLLADQHHRHAQPLRPPDRLPDPTPW
jgi:hypothetical protein